jgi:hypothetical protein
MLLNELNGDAWYAGDVFITEWRIGVCYKYRYLGRYRTGVAREVVYLLKEDVTLEEGHVYKVRVEIPAYDRSYVVAKGATVEKIVGSLGEIGLMRKMPPGMREWIEDVLSEVAGC